MQFSKLNFLFIFIKLIDSLKITSLKKSKNNKKYYYRDVIKIFSRSGGNYHCTF